MLEIEFDRVRKKLFAKALSQKRNCLIAGCMQPAIRSHVLQRRGILNHILSNGHLYEVSFLQYPSLRYIIKKVGWKDALTFSGLCAFHDCYLFKAIELDTIDFSDYKSLLLLSYRPLLHEYRLKEIVREVFHKLKLHPTISKEIDPIGIHVLIEAQTWMLWDIEYTIQNLQTDLSTESRHFSFELFSLPKIEVCTSIIFSYKSLADSFKTFPEIDLKQKEPIANILFHLIPCENETRLILGYLNDSEAHIKPRIDFLKGLAQHELLKEISDMLIKSCETWACSEKFYINNIKEREKTILKLMNYYVLRRQFTHEHIDINLFNPLN